MTVYPMRQRAVARRRLGAQTPAQGFFGPHDGGRVGDAHAHVAIEWQAVRPLTLQRRPYLCSTAVGQHPRVAAGEHGGMAEGDEALTGACEQNWPVLQTHGRDTR